MALNSFDTLLACISFRYLTDVREKLIFTLRSQFFRQINALCLRFHLKHTSGELYSYLFGSPLQQVQQYFFQLTMFGIQAGFMLVTTLIWVFTWDSGHCLGFHLLARLQLRPDPRHAPPDQGPPKRFPKRGRKAAARWLISSAAIKRLLHGVENRSSSSSIRRR